MKKNGKNISSSSLVYNNAFISLFGVNRKYQLQPSTSPPYLSKGVHRILYLCITGGFCIECFRTWSIFIHTCGRWIRWTYKSRYISCASYCSISLTPTHHHFVIFHVCAPYRRSGTISDLYGLFFVRRERTLLFIWKLSPKQHRLEKLMLRCISWLLLMLRLILVSQ